MPEEESKSESARATLANIGSTLANMLVDIAGILALVGLALTDTGDAALQTVGGMIVVIVTGKRYADYKMQAARGDEP